MAREHFSRRTFLTGGVSVSALGFLSACASIPSQGPVNHYADAQGTSSNEASQVSVEGPADGASQQDIIRGFISAGASSADDYGVARQYLTEDFASRWKPDERALVYSNKFTVAADEGQTYRVTVPVATQISASGVATSYADVNEVEDIFSLVQVDGQWRISSAPHGLILEQGEFEESFSTFTLYFYDPTFTYAVPDTRWFANRSTVSAAVVRVLLEGPASYLQGAASSAIPANTALMRNSVPVEGTSAVVSLTGAGVSEGLSQLDLERIHTQLEQTLSLLNGIETVSLKLNDQEVTVGSLENYIKPQINAAVSENVVALDGQNLVLLNTLFSSGQTVAYSLDNQDAAYTAVSYNRQSIAYLSAERSELSLVRDGQRSLVMQGKGLTAPSFDQFQWLWSSDEAGSVRVISAPDSAAEAQTVAADWLAGAGVSSLRISRDGVRAAITAESDSDYFLWVSGVKRNADNQPLELTQPIRVSTSIPAQYAAWASDTSILVANFEMGESELVDITTGKVTALKHLDSMVRVSAASGKGTLVAQTQNQTLYTLAGQSWTRYESPLSEVAFSG